MDGGVFFVPIRLVSVPPNGSSPSHEKVALNALPSRRSGHYFAAYFPLLVAATLCRGMKPNLPSRKSISSN